GASDVRSRSAAVFADRPYRAGAVVRRGRGLFRAGADDIDDAAVPGRVRARCRGALYHRRVLVHGVDILCQSSRHHCPEPVEHFCRYCASRCAGVHPGPDRRCAGRAGFCALAVLGDTKGDRIVTITIYHNPECGTSRNTLAMIRQSGEEPEVIEYLKSPPTRERLVELIAAMG